MVGHGPTDGAHQVKQEDEKDTFSVHLFPPKSQWDLQDPILTEMNRVSPGLRTMLIVFDLNLLWEKERICFPDFSLIGRAMGVVSTYFPSIETFAQGYTLSFMKLCPWLLLA
jgi:hypothetical protein